MKLFSLNTKNSHCITNMNFLPNNRRAAYHYIKNKKWEISLTTHTHTLTHQNTIFTVHPKSHQGQKHNLNQTTKQPQEIQHPLEKVQRPLQYGDLLILNLEKMGWALCIRWFWLNKTDSYLSWEGLPIQVPHNAQALFAAAARQERRRHRPSSGHTGG